MFLGQCPFSFLYVKAVVAILNQEKALVEEFADPRFQLWL